MSSLKTQTAFPDVLWEQNFRSWGKGIATAALLGLVRTADTGQVNWDAPLAYSPNTYTYVGGSSSSNPYNAFDANTGNYWETDAAPTVSIPKQLCFDAGIIGGVTQIPTVNSYQVWLANNTFDPKDWKLQSSADGVTWADADTQAAQVGTGAYKTFNLSGAVTARYWRLLITAANGATTCRVVEWRLFSAASAGGTLVSVPTQYRPTGNSVAAVWEMFRFNDALQTPSGGVGMSGFIKIEYGNGGTTFISDGYIYPAVWVTIGTATDGAGNFVGNTTTRQQLASSGYARTAQKMAYGVANNRFFAAMFYNHAGWIWFAFERTHNAAGADTDEGIQIAGQSSGGQIIHQVLPKTGAVPPAETLIGCLLPNNSTGLYGTKISSFALQSWLGKWLYPMIGVQAYLSADLTSELVYTGSSYGADHTYFCLGNNPTNVRANASSRIMMLDE